MALKNITMVLKNIIRVYDVTCSPMHVYDDRLVTYFVNKEGSCWHSFPMCNVSKIELFTSCELLIEETYDNQVSNTIVVYDNSKITNHEFKRLTKSKNKFFGKEYNCADVPIPEY